MKIVQDLGEDIFPEEITHTSNILENDLRPQPTIPSEDTPAVTEDKPLTVTTERRKPLAVPDTVHIHITPSNLKEYVGPPIFHKDRLYDTPPPAGVSTGLGYLGNGSGAVMPVEATVRPSILDR